jgi:hypothetical protein
VADTERELPEGGHDAVLLGADLLADPVAVFLEREPGGNLDGRPQRPLRRAVLGPADDDVSGERIALREQRERGLELRGLDLPGDECPLREVGGEQRLPDAPDDADTEHRLDALDHGLDRQAAPLGDQPERIADEALDLVFGDLEDAPVDLVLR